MRKKKKRYDVEFDPMDYDYLDNLDKDGWHWEFTRRNVNYQKAYDEMLRLQKESDPSCKDFANCFKCKIGSQNENAKNCLWDQYSYVEEHFNIRNTPTPQNPWWNIPDPNLEYPKQLFFYKPLTTIKPIYPMKIMTSEELKIKYDFIKERFKKNLNMLWSCGGDPKANMKTIVTFLDHDLSPDLIFEDAFFKGDYKNDDVLKNMPISIRNKAEDRGTLFFSISLSASREELRSAFEDVLKKYIRPKISVGDTKLQPNKWKNGLMMWDIRTNHRLSLKEAGDKIDIAENTAKKQYYRTYELIYRKKYESAYFKRPAIKKEYLSRVCDNCGRRNTCKDICPNVLAFVNQDTRQYQREQCFGNMELLTKHGDDLLFGDSTDMS